LSAECGHGGDCGGDGERFNKDNMKNKLVLVGNGFDLAHGLKTSYKDFLDWYMCDAFKIFLENENYNDRLIEIKNEYSGMNFKSQTQFTRLEEALNFFDGNRNQSIFYNSNFFKALLDRYSSNNWIDIECYYFRNLKAFFLNPNLNSRKDVVGKLNSDFDFLIKKLSEYIQKINLTIAGTPKLPIDNSRFAVKKLFAENNQNTTKFLNFNYTETLHSMYGITQEEIIHIHGRAADIEKNPIIFGYGDESDPDYQKIEDSGENLYLEHIKSFGYFRTNNYQKLLLFLDSENFEVSIVGHSCGLSDRVLLNEIFEHPNCKKIEIFYHQRSDGSDNFKEITQEISRHFKPQNKGVMRRKVADKNDSNVIPQNR
jgi:Bacteriophage abortive infection AbiH